MRFTIRDLLWLMVVVSILGAWWVDHKLYSSWERKGIWMDMELRAAGWHVIDDASGHPTLISPEELRRPHP